MKFKQPIASNQETNKWVIKDTKFKARNQEFSQLGKEKKKKKPRNKKKIQKIETWWWRLDLSESSLTLSIDTILFFSSPIHGTGVDDNSVREFL